MNNSDYLAFVKTLYISLDDALKRCKKENNIDLCFRVMENLLLVLDEKQKTLSMSDEEYYKSIQQNLNLGGSALAEQKKKNQLDPTM
jgi:hypothetical protein